MGHFSKSLSSCPHQKASWQTCSHGVPWRFSISHPSCYFTQIVKDLPKRVKALELAIKLGAAQPPPSASTGGTAPSIHPRSSSHQGSRRGSPDPGTHAGNGQDGEGEEDGVDGGGEAAFKNGGQELESEQAEDSAPGQDKGRGSSRGLGVDRGSGKGKKGVGVRYGPPMTLPELQQKVEELEAKLKEAEQVHPVQA